MTEQRLSKGSPTVPGYAAPWPRVQAPHRTGQRNRQLLRAVKLIVRFLASYALGIATLFFLLVLTFLGTLEQIDHGLYATQQKYFNSLFLVHEIKGMPILPLPGVYLLLVVLGINMLLGAVMRFRWGWRSMGVFIVHVGILVMLLGGFITYHYSSDGHLTLYEGESSNEFQSYYDWEILIAEANSSGRALVIPGESFRDLTGDATRAFTSVDLPFELELSTFMPNSMPVMGAGGAPEGGPFSISPLPLESQNERNVAGIRVRVKDRDGGATRDAELWGMSRDPYLFESGGTEWGLTLQRRRWQMPFTVSLDRFTRELHPGTAMPSSFSSDVTVAEPEGSQRIHISMNRPLRHKGYTLFQASWGPSNAGPNDPLFSTLAVVRNPADQFPIYGFTVITLGLLIHFCQKLFLFLRNEAVRT
jgi:hypothetical protein